MWLGALVSTPGVILALCACEHSKRVAWCACEPSNVTTAIVIHEDQHMSTGTNIILSLTWIGGREMAPLIGMMNLVGIVC